MTWTRCAVWGKTAESAAHHLVKGQQVIVRGRLQPDPDTGHPKLFRRQDGSVGASYEIRVFHLDFGAKPNNANGHQDVMDDADDIPF